MKYKNSEVINIARFLNTLLEKRFPQRISYAIMRNTNSFQNELDIYLNSLKKLTSNYSEHFIKDKNGKPVITSTGVPDVKDEVKNDYIKELNELIEIEVDIELFKIPEETFNYSDEKYDVLSPRELIWLIDLFGEKAGNTDDKK